MLSGGNNFIIEDFLDNKKDGLFELKNLIPGVYDNLSGSWNEIKFTDELNGYLSFKKKALVKEGINLFLHPTPQASRVLPYIMQDEKLIQQALIRASACTYPGKYYDVKSAAIIGLTFERALTIALKEGFHKSVFYALEPELYSQWSTTAYLVIHLKNQLKERQPHIELESWQGSQGNGSTLYIHAMFSSNFDYCIHLDGAVIELNSEDLATLFQHGRKVKGNSYAKHFRLDGNIPLISFQKIMNEYFLTDALTNEYFQEMDFTNKYFHGIGTLENGCLKKINVALASE